MIKKVLKEKVEHVTQIDGQQVILAVELSFNFQNGQFTISCPIKTKAVSRDSLIQKAIITQVGTMYHEVFARALQLRNEWVEANPEEEETQPRIPFPEEGEEGEEEEGNERATDDDNVQLSFSAASGSKRRSK
jgi:hypothetical protein